MGQDPALSAKFAARLGALVLLAAAVPLPVHAQSADAGVERAAAPPPEARPEPSGVLPKAIDPGQLSEATRARLAERAAARHASSVSAHEPVPRHDRPPSPAASNTTVLPYRPSVTGSDTLRRGQTRTRVQAVETGKGVTLLSNRVHIPEPRLSAAVAKRPLPEPEQPVVEESVAASDAPDVTETRSLRPMSRSAKKNVNTGLGWLLWPFVLFVTTGAVLGTLWFRKKTE
jgi:hypothetical protein